MTGDWKTETAQYLHRITSVQDKLRTVYVMTKQIPAGPFTTQLTAEQAVTYRLTLFANNGLIAVDQLFNSVNLLWSDGRMVGISGLVRFGLEYWAAVNFGRGVLEGLEQDGDIEKASAKAARLTCSGKTPVALPWGGKTTDVAYNILTFIDNLNIREPNARHFYDLLSEASHPNFLQNTYFIMCGRCYDNFSNKTFAAHAHQLLKETITCMEITAGGLSEDVGEILKIALPKLPVE